MLSGRGPLFPQFPSHPTTLQPTLNPLNQANLWPEVLATALLAAAHLVLLAVAVGLATAWLLLGLPETSRAISRLWQLSGLAAGTAATVDAPCDLPPPNPAAAFTRLRCLSLRRCTLAAASVLTASHPNSGSNHNASRGGHSGSGGLLTLWASGGVDSGQAGELPSRRQRACSAGGSVLLHWLLPRACGVALMAGTAWRALALPCFARCRSSSSARPRGPHPPHPPTSRLAVLLSSCPDLRFVDLTFASGSATSWPNSASGIISSLQRAGNVHYLAVGQPARVQLDEAAFGGAEGGWLLDEDRVAEEEDGEGAGRDGYGGVGSGGGGVRGARQPVVDQQWWRAAPAGPLLVECPGFDEIIARELGL